MTDKPVKAWAVVDANGSIHLKNIHAHAFNAHQIADRLNRKGLYPPYRIAAVHITPEVE